jgi:hypothetical protein
VTIASRPVPVAALEDSEGRAAQSLLHAVAHKARDDICLKLFRRSEVGRAFARVALLELGKSAPIERAGQLRIESQRRIIVGDGQPASGNISPRGSRVAATFR